MPNSAIDVRAILCMYPREAFPGANPSSSMIGTFCIDIITDPNGDEGFDIDSLRRDIVSELTPEQSKMAEKTHYIIIISPQTGTVILTRPP